MPLALDPTTRAEYDAAQTAEARASVVLDALTGTVAVVVRDGTDAVRGTGTMQAPWATVSGTQLLIGEVSSFAVTDGGTPDAGWYLAFEAGDRWLRGTFGLADSSANFKWSLPTFTTGQNGMLGTVAARAQGRASIEASYETTWGILTFAQSDLEASWALAPTEAWATIPTISFEQGTAATRDVAQYLLSEGTVAHQGTLPAGVTFNATLLRFEYDGVGASAATVGNTLEVTPFAEEIATFSMVSGVTGTMPFCFGHAFVEGDAPGFIDSDLPAFQAEIKNRWPDGSVKFAIISGITDFVAGQTRTISLRKASAATSGTVVSLAQLDAVLDYGSVTLELAPYGTVDLKALVAQTSAGYGSPGLVRTWQSGPQCSEWHFYSPVGTDPHLAVWFHVRMFADGSIEVETIVESGWAMVPGVEDKVYTPTLTINGSARYAPGATLLHKHHSRWVRSDWYATDPQVVPQHDVAYLRSTKMVPNYGWNTPPETTWTRTIETKPLPTTINPTPFDQGNYRTAMTAGALSETIAWAPVWEALYASSGDARAYVGMMANARLAGRFMLCYRDEDDMLPIRGDNPEYVTRGFAGAAGMSNVGGSVSRFSTAAESLGAYTGQGWDDAHAPGAGYIAYLASGRFFFVESMQFAGAVGLFIVSTAVRIGGVPLIPVNRQARANAWTFRHLSQAYTATPDDESVMRGALSASLDRTYSYYLDKITVGPYVNNLGRFDALADYRTTLTAVSLSPWQQHYWILSLGMARNMGAWGATEGRDALLALLEQAYKHPVGLLGTNASFNYRRGGSYEIVYGYSEVLSSKTPDTWLQSWAEVYAACSSVLGWEAMDDAPGLSLSNPYGLSNSDPWRSLIASIALAKEHEAAGADEAWALLTSSTDWQSQQAEFNNDPTYGWVPRT